MNKIKVTENTEIRQIKKRTSADAAAWSYEPNKIWITFMRSLLVDGLQSGQNRYLAGPNIAGYN